MATFCPALVRGRRFRFTRLDACGVPVVGPSSSLVTSGLVSASPSPQYENTDPIRVLNAAGELCINEPGTVNFAQEDIELVFCKVDPTAFNMMTGAPLVLDDATPTPNVVGFRKQCGPVDERFALEIWSDVSGQPCTTGNKLYWYSLWPLLTNAQWGDATIENGAINFTITASAFCGSPWGVGPYDVINALPGPAPSPLLTAITADDLYHGQETDLAPPVADCSPGPIPVP